MAICCPFLAPAATAQRQQHHGAAAIAEATAPVGDNSSRSDFVVLRTMLFRYRCFDALGELSNGGPKQHPFT